MNINDMDRESFDRAKQASEKCRHCYGGGFKAVFHQDYQGNSVLGFRDHEGNPRNKAGVVASHCVCDLGRWIRSHCPVSLKARFPDLIDVFCDRTEWVSDDPIGGDVPEELWDMTISEAVRYVSDHRRTIGVNVSEAKT